MTCLAQLLPNTPYLYRALYPLWAVNLLGTMSAGVFVLRNALRAIPRDLEDAAKIDGCGFWRVCWHAMLPAVRPALGLLGLFFLVAALDDAMAPLIEQGGNGPYAFYAFHLSAHGSSIDASSLGLLMACSLLVALGIIAIFLFARRFGKG
jgi:multiple sugar transport system permease protein